MYVVLAVAGCPLPVAGVLCVATVVGLRYASVLLGLVQGAAFGWAERNRKNVVGELAPFGGLFVAVLILSAALFYTAPHQGMWETIFFYFPQLLVLVLMIPGAVCLTALMWVIMTRKKEKT